MLEKIKNYFTKKEIKPKVYTKYFSVYIHMEEYAGGDCLFDKEIDRDNFYNHLLEISKEFNARKQIFLHIDPKTHKIKNQNIHVAINLNKIIKIVKKDIIKEEEEE